MRPEMLVLDEPAYALDPIGRVELYSVLKDLKENHGMTVLLAERDAEEAAAFSDRLVLMKGGRILGSGPPRLMLRDPEDMRSIGVTPPQVAEVARLLNARLMSSKFSFLNVDEAEKTIIGEVLASKAGGMK
jgi:energy-coupling factor transporter ATP-binding protein EcfA2